LVIGSGPTGLGAATRLQHHKLSSWLLIEATDIAGGSARTDTTKEGFMFDQGGHVVFSHSKYFDDLVIATVGSDAWNVVERSTYVWIRNRLVPYPFQNNINALDVEDQVACVNGLIDASQHSQLVQPKPTNFDEWIIRVMGVGIAELYMRPYNFKVWGFPTKMLQSEWLGDPAARPINLKHCIENILQGRRAPAPRISFRYPKRGGTGSVWNAVAKSLPQEKLKYGQKVTALDLPGHMVVLQDGTIIKYKNCISSMPLDYTLQLIGRDDLASKLLHSSSHIIGLGLRGKNPHGRKCWFYYPETNCAFYRCSCFSTYSKNNVPAADALLPTLWVGSKQLPQPSQPEAGPYWSLMFEISESSMKPVRLSTIMEDTIKGAIAVQLFTEETEIVSLFHSRISHGYPVPTIDRDKVLDEALPLLKDNGFLSRGRFGSYKYEVSNQDHCVLIGVEAADHLLFGTAEVTHSYPHLVGRSKNLDLSYSSTPFLDLEDTM